MNNSEILKKIINEADEEEKEDISETPKVQAEITFEYRVREDFSHNVIGEEGSKTILITEKNYYKIATFFWENVVEALDFDFFATKKGDTSLKFYLEVDFSLKPTGGNYTFRIYFDVDKEEGEFKVRGWSFGNVISASHSLRELNLRLRKLFETFFNL